MSNTEVWETIAATPTAGKWQHRYRQDSYSVYEDCPALLIQEHRWNVNAAGETVEQARPFRTRCVYARAAGDGTLTPAADRAGYIETILP